MDPFSHYPSEEEVNQWADQIWKKAESAVYTVEVLPINPFTLTCYPFQVVGHNQYLKFTVEGMGEFYALFQPVLSGPAPLAVHTSGYGAEFSLHNEIQAAGFNVLHIQPLGYLSPEGKNTEKMVNGNWPVCPNSLDPYCEEGYFGWLAQCVIAIRCIQQHEKVLKDRVSFFGTSQGGGGALLLGSMFREKGLRCIGAEQPFLTDFAEADFEGAYSMAKEAFERQEDPARAWHALGLVDTISHAFRIQVPTLLSTSKNDAACPERTVKRLFERLSCVKAICDLDYLNHGYSAEFIQFFTAWLKIYG